MTPEEYQEADRDIFASEVLMAYNAELRGKVFRLVEAFSIDPYSVPNWSACIGSAVELSGFIDEAMCFVRIRREMNQRLLQALHDAIERPKGVVPDSALEFYDPALTDDNKSV
jgi:hypothetical protein